MLSIDGLRADAIDDPTLAADIPIDEAYEKLRNEAAAARMLRERSRA
jgi:hypothetical protein